MLNLISDDPTFILFCSRVGEQETLVTGNLTWSVSGSALHVVGLTTRIVGILVTAVREAQDGLGCRAGFAGGQDGLGVTLTVLKTTRPGT